MYIKQSAQMVEAEEDNVARAMLASLELRLNSN